ncbi:MAG TPA: hypothetical protein VLA19_14765 [Herpetosiphonaceae bacterium]|nr:hypothetical protein [Herpetosiphonaceae bacterium]
MMGTKVRLFEPITNASLEDLVPQAHFSRHLEQSLDLSFVRDLVRTADAGSGRPSVVRMVFCTRQ